MKRAITILIISTLLMLLSAATADVLTLPSALTTIEDEAFYGDKSLDKVVLGESVTVIGARAFGNSGLKEVTLTRSITAIADDAFEGCGEFKVNVPIGCFAYAWCVNHGYITKPDPTPAEYFTYETINGLYARITGYTGPDAVVVIPEEIDDYTIQKISNNTFKNNKTIEYVYVPDSVIEIGASAFYGCSALTGVNVGEGVTTIGNEAFRDCRNLLGVDFPESLTTTGSGIFRNCVNLEYFDYPLNWIKAGEYTIAGCQKITEINIPKGVIVVPEYAFRYCDNLTSINISDTVEKISQYSFGNCRGITKITIPENVIELNGFQNCSALCDVVLSTGLNTLGDGAFSGCTALKQLDLPEGLTEIGNNVFNGCIALREIVFPEGLSKIGLYSFKGCSAIIEVTLPDSVSEIGSSAFENCTNLTSFHYPLSLNTVIRVYSAIDSDNGYIFKGCKSLKTIAVPEGVTEIPMYTFRGSDYLRSITLPSSLKIIGRYSFTDCTSIRRISFPDAVNSIGIYAFKGCTYLEEAILPDSVTEIGSSAFENCTNLASFHYPVNLNTIIRVYSAIDSDNGYIFKGCKTLKSISVPEGVTEIPMYTFRGSDYLQSITLPDTLTTIGRYSFTDCTSIRKIDFPASIITIGIYAFKGCIYLEEAILPDGVKKIGSSAFENCSNLSSFHYPVNLNTIIRVYSAIDSDNGYIFKGCTSLESINVPEGVTSIPMYAFRGADCLCNITLPSSLTSIGRYAFTDCTSIHIVSFPDAIKTVGIYAFKGCTNLEEAILPDGVTEIGSSAFENCTNLTSFHYPASLNTIIRVYSAIDSDNGYIFKGCSSLESISVPEGVTAIPMYTFRGADHISDITLPSTLTSIGKYSFAECKTIEKLYLSYSVSTIGNNAFANCNMLTIWTEYGSVALQYAINNNIPYYYLSLNGGTYPSGTKYKGDSFDFYGFIRSNHIVTRITATVFSAASQNNVLSVDIQPNIYVCDLSELVNSSLPLNTLDLGDYTYSISASTDMDTETFIVSNFSIIPAPLRTDNDCIFAPCGSLMPGVPFNISGTILSNYAIQQAVVGIYNTSGAAIYSQTMTPNATSVDISEANSALLFSLLPSGQYYFRIYITGNGETLIAYESTFTVLTMTADQARLQTFNAAFYNDSYGVNENLRTATVLMSDAAYNKNQSIAQVKAYGFDDIETDYSISFQGCAYTFGWKDIEKSNGSITRVFIIVCRGTGDEQWLSDFTLFEDTSYHYGFNNGAKKVYSAFSNYLSRKLGDTNISDCKVLLTGHSRGAAVVNILAGRDMKKLGFLERNIYCYSFACPCVYRGSLSGSKVFTDQLPNDSNIYNYNLGGDLVGRVPFEEWGYSRFGYTLCYPNGKTVRGMRVNESAVLDDFVNALAIFSSEEQQAFFQSIKEKQDALRMLGLSAHSNTVFLLQFTTCALVRACIQADKVGAYTFWNDSISFIAWVITTHESNTYVRWICSM